MKKRKRTGGLFLLLLLFLSGCGASSSAYFDKAAQEETEAALETELCMEETERTEDCYVYLCGAVANPGVYRLLAGSRVYEAVRMAGGLTETACADSVNQAEEVSDGQMIKVLTMEEAEAQDTLKQTAETAADGRVDLNTAGLEDLMSLPGIGSSKAEKILAYREEKGRFSSAEEIMNITGIKEGVYSKIKDYITVN